MTTPSLAPLPDAFGAPDFTLAGRAHVAYRVSLDGPLLAGSTTPIEMESRGPDGAALVSAAALARWGARVRLEIAGVGDDAHGRFIERELASWPNLELVLNLDSGLLTPYAIVLRDSDGQISVLTNHWVAGTGGGDDDADPVPSEPEAALGTADLAWAVEHFARWAGSRLPQDAVLKASLVAGRLTRKYRESFGGLETIPSREELEAAFRSER